LKREKEASMSREGKGGCLLKKELKPQRVKGKKKVFGGEEGGQISAREGEVHQTKRERELIGRR